jgi:hypothetical protein
MYERFEQPNKVIVATHLFFFTDKPGSMTLTNFTINSTGDPFNLANSTVLSMNIRQPEVYKPTNVNFNNMLTDIGASMDFNTDTNFFILKFNQPIMITKIKSITYNKKSDMKLVGVFTSGLGVEHEEKQSPWFESPNTKGQYLHNYNDMQWDAFNAKMMQLMFGGIGSLQIENRARADNVIQESVQRRARAPGATSLNTPRPIAPVVPVRDVATGTTTGIQMMQALSQANAQTSTQTNTIDLMNSSIQTSLPQPAMSQTPGDDVVGPPVLLGVESGPVNMNPVNMNPVNMNSVSMNPTIELNCICPTSTDGSPMNCSCTQQGTSFEPIPTVMEPPANPLNKVQYILWAIKPSPQRYGNLFSKLQASQIIARDLNGVNVLKGAKVIPFNMGEYMKQQRPSSQFQDDVRTYIMTDGDAGKLINGGISRLESLTNGTETALTLSDPNFFNTIILPQTEFKQYDNKMFVPNLAIFIGLREPTDIKQLEYIGRKECCNQPAKNYVFSFYNEEMKPVANEVVFENFQGTDYKTVSAPIVYKETFVNSNRIRREHFSQSDITNNDFIGLGVILLLLYLWSR